MPIITDASDLIFSIIHLCFLSSPSGCSSDNSVPHHHLLEQHFKLWIIGV